MLAFGGTGHSADAADGAKIKKSPAFSAKQLMALPTSQWVTNGGTVYNQRYSPLDQINRDNVAGLKAVWKTSMGSGKSPGNSGEAQILEYDGTLFVVNGADDVVAISVETGKILWKYEGKINPKAGNPFGRTSRGVAMGDGKIFVGQLDAKLVALDQKTGKVVWSTPAADWKQGFAITSAPLYYDGLVITGFNGGEMGTRGRVVALNAKTGKVVWTFYTVPGPGEPGHETWPQNSNAWRLGGAPVWQTPAVDPKLGLMYFSTGNPGPDLNGSVREGDNLYSNSIVAIDIKTGKYKWHFQQVHHDIWDYDSPNPIVLFDAKVNGEMRKGLVEVSKTGWAYILDRVTGKPLIGIVEKPVPQEPRQKTAATQPYPIGDSIVPQEIEIVPEGAKVDENGQIPNHGRIFTPFWTDQIMVKPATMGGANWPPSSYDPTTHTLYVCATDRISTFQISPKLEEPKPNGVYMGGHFGQAEANDRGIFAALDVTTNKLKWRQSWREICYSGSIVTKGGLLFVGRSDGRLTALDKRNGKMLWHFMTDAGMNTTATTFMYKGTQYVVIHAGGSVFGNGKRGDTIWAFSLKGTIGPVATAAPRRAGRPAGSEARGFGPGPGGGAAAKPAKAAMPPANRKPDLNNGAQRYKTACVPCHGEDGKGGHGGGPTLVEGLSVNDIWSVAYAGKNQNMPAFGDQMSAADLQDISSYITDVLAKKK
jgi:quinohemoprotein ethanol dehydrogenase